MSKQRSAKVTLEEYFEFGGDAYKKELSILREFARHKTEDQPLIGGGNTEVFDIDVLGLDT